MELGLKDKVVGITGGSTGIGAAVALGFAAEGAKVAVCGRNTDKLQTLKRQFDEAGYPLYIESVDVSDLKQLEDFVHHIAQEYGRLDIFINNAGTNNRKCFEDYTSEEFDTLINANMKSVFFGTHYAAEEMRKVGGGVILNTSSFTALIPTANIALYSATKAAVSNMTQTFAVSLAPDHIRVNAVIPGMTVTPLTAKNIEKNQDQLVSSIGMRRLATPEDMVGAYLFLASDTAAGYVDGISLPVAGAKFCSQDPLWGWKYREGAL